MSQIVIGTTASDQYFYCDLCSSFSPCMPLMSSVAQEGILKGGCTSQQASKNALASAPIVFLSLLQQETESSINLYPQLFESLI